MNSRFWKPNFHSMAAVSKVLFRPSCGSRSSQFGCARRRIFSRSMSMSRSEFLHFKDDPLNQLRKRDSFVDDVRGLSHAEIIRAAVAAKKNILTVGATGSGKTHS